MLLVLACLACCVAARAAPSSPRCLPESELDGYCQRRLDVDAQLASDEQTPTITGHVMEDSGINSISTAVKAWLENRTTAKKKYGHISTWDTSLVTDMTALFCAQRPHYTKHDISHTKDCAMPTSASDFNDNIGAWDTSSVTVMDGMFGYASKFDQPIGGWSVDKVTSMWGMFGFASAFNQPIGHWSLDKVTNTEFMFAAASSFNQPIGGWSVNKVTAMAYMFGFASSFNQPLGDWQVDKVTDMYGMFFFASSFNQSIDNWSVDSVTSMTAMFRSASSFNHPLQSWSLEKGVSLGGMFTDAISFDQDLGWCVDDNLNLGYTFEDTRCSSTSCGVHTCPKRSKNNSAKRAKHERNIALIIGGVLFACLLFLGCALVSYRRKQHELELERSEIVQEQCTAARDQIQEFQAHFVTIAGPRFLAFDRLRSHEECREELIIYDLVAEVRDASTRGEVFIFFSHQWLGWSEPDPNRIHIKAMQQAVRAVSNDTDTPLEKIRVWVDYVSIPQKNHSVQKLAIASLPTFASVSD